MMEFYSEADSPDLKMHRDVERQIYACMETGNIQQAATLMDEYDNQYPEQAATLRSKVTRDYGTGL